jgi:hypothetical protein
LFASEGTFGRRGTVSDSLPTYRFSGCACGTGVGSANDAQPREFDMHCVGLVHRGSEHLQTLDRTAVAVIR